MGLTHEDVAQILAILDAADCEKADIRSGDLTLRLGKNGRAPGRPQPAVPPGPMRVQDGGAAGKPLHAALPAMAAKEHEAAPPAGIDPDERIRAESAAATGKMKPGARPV
jgi:hypothetical protein